MTDQTATPAVIYCRVSSAAQTKRGDGLGSQEARCREYAKFKGYEVVERFHDDLSGKLLNRPGMEDMLAFIRKLKADTCVVLIDDINRLARDVMTHWELREIILKAGGRLESPSIEFKQDADSRMVENVLAGAAQHQREKNAEQTYNRMRARLMNGYWAFAKPRGYHYEKTRDTGKVLVRDEPLASVIQEALEGFASGRFETQVEVKRFLESRPEVPKDGRDGTVHNQRVADMLNQKLYAGYLEAPNWNVPLRKANHEPLISLETYQAIQDRLKAGAKAPARKDISEDFPLRGFVTCGDCGQPLTACYSTSRTGKKHPYYLCHTKGCTSYRKSIPQARLEGEFDSILQTLQPTETLFALVRSLLKDAWSQRLAQTKHVLADLKQDVARIEKDIDRFLTRIVETEQPTVIAAYERKISELEKQKLLAVEKLANGARPRKAFEELFELALGFLSNPCKLWESGHLPLRKMVLRLTFSERLSYHRETGFSNPNLSLPFSLLTDIGRGEIEMARPKRFELLTPRFVVWCSIQLSYGRFAFPRHRSVPLERRTLAKTPPHCKPLFAFPNSHGIHCIKEFFS